MKVFTPPTPPAFDRHELVVFAGGSIEMDTAEEWQIHLIKLLRNAEQPQVRSIVVLNPRRADWDSSWLQSMDDPNFVIQVNWELDGIDDANVVVFYFDPKTKSPITLMELGLAAGLFPEKIVVICAEGFWRKGNVDILCDRHDIKQVATIADAVSWIMDNAETL
jgi:hypothetical protein